jgi:uncharacterized membrane protein
MHETASSMPEQARHRDEAGVEFSRIVAFTDGVFAIAITLLVLQLEVPHGVSDVGEALADQTGDLFAYALSFAVIGKFWLAHHRFFGSLARFDNTLMGMNLLYLAWLALVPFTSEVLGEYGDETDAAVAYAISLAGVTLTFQAQIVYAYRRDLIQERARVYERRFVGPANFFVSAVFLLSIPVAIFVSASAAELTWLAIFFVGRRASDKLSGQQAPR